MADSSTLNATVTPEAIAQAGSEILELASYAYATQTGKLELVEYSPQVGQDISDIIHSIDVPGMGILSLDALAEAQEKAFAGLIEQQTGRQVSAAYVSNLIDQAEMNIKVLDSVYDQGVRITPTDEGVSLSQGGLDIASYSIAEIDAQRNSAGNVEVVQTSPRVEAESTSVASVNEAQPVVTRIEPSEAIPADVRERVMRIEQAMSNMIPVIESKNSGVDIPDMGAIDGVLDKDSYAAFDKTMQFLAQKAEVDFSKGCTDEFCSELQNKLNRYFTIEKGKLEAELLGAKGFAKFNDSYKEKVTDLEQQIKEMEAVQNSVPTLMADVNSLNNSGYLRPIEMTEVQVNPVVAPVQPAQANPATVVVTDEPASADPVVASPPPSSPVVEASTVVATEASADVKSAIDNVEDAMSRVIDNIDKIPLGGFADKIGSFKDMLVKPIDKTDGEFNANSQEMASTLLMVLKTVNGVENADGTYNERIGDQLQVDILSKDDFAFLRKELGINGQFTPAEANVLMRGSFVPEDFVQVDGLSEEANNKRLEDHIAKQEAARVEFVVASAKLRQGNEDGLMKLNALFDGLDTLAEKDMLDPEKKAAEKTKNNLMFDIAGGFLEKTGMLSGIKDFFTNNAIGQFLGTILGMVGFDVNRLWGEKGADLENSKEMASKLGDDFERVYKKIESENPGSDFNDVMRLTKEQTMDGMNGFWGGNAIKLALGSDNKEMLTAAVSEALDEASKAGDLESAKAIFVERIEEFGDAYKNGKTIELAGKEYSKVDNGLGNDLDRAIQVSSHLREDYIANFGATVVDELDADAIKLNDNQALDTVINYDTDSKEQGVGRFGDVEPIQKYLYENAEKLGLDQDNIAKFAVEGEDGSIEFNKTLDIETCAAIEEMWVKAKLHEYITEAKAQDTDITGEMIDGWVKAIDDEKLAKGPGADGGIHPELVADLETMKQYAEAKGALEGFQAVEDNNIIEAEEALVSMDTDMQSSADGGVKEFSVLEQSLTWNQVDITKLALEVKQDLQPPKIEPPVEEPAHDNGGSCEDDCRQVLTNNAEPELRSIVDGRGNQDINPRNYRDLPVFDLGTREAQFLRELLVEKDPGLGERAKELGQDPIERFAMDMKQTGGNQYLLMDLREMGVEGSHPNFDGVMIHLGRGLDSVPEIRYYDHERHGINSLGEHRLNAAHRFETDNPLAPSDKDFDTFFSLLDRQNTNLTFSPSSNSGFRGIPVVTENLSLKDGYAAVYGDAAYAQELRNGNYRDSYAERKSIYQGAENADYIQGMQNSVKSLGNPQASVSELIQPRVDEFNSRSGYDRIDVSAQSNMVVSVQVTVEVQQAINDIGGDQFDPSVDNGYVPGMGNTNTMSVGARTA